MGYIQGTEQGILLTSNISTIEVMIPTYHN